MILKCNRPNCKHSWYPKIPGKLPLVCPRCKSYDWSKKGQVSEDNK